MKHSVKALCLLALSITLIGCSSSGEAGSTLYSEEEVVSLLKNDDSPEFVLDGNYYSLPEPASKFIEDGWTLAVENYEDQEVILQPEERVKGSFTKEDKKVSVSIANTEEHPLDVTDCSVIQVYIMVKQDKPEFLITKYGITTTTSEKHAKKALQNQDGYEESKGNLYLSSTGDLGDRTILRFNNSDGYTAIQIEAIEDWNYRLYKPMAEKAQEQADNIAAYKKNAEKNCPSNYDEIVQSLKEATSLHTVPFYSINGSVVIKGTGNYEGTENNFILGQDLFLYIVQDSSGQLYCINEGFAEYGRSFRLPELTEGDTLSLWGLALQITRFEDGYEIPTVLPEIVEMNGEIIYLSNNLTVE